MLPKLKLHHVIQGDALLNDYISQTLYLIHHIIDIYIPEYDKILPMTVGCSMATVVLGMLLFGVTMATKDCS